MKTLPHRLLFAASISLSLMITIQGLQQPALRVAVLGSGIAGSTAARHLADAGVRVTVFECGRGVGGRTSTRVTRDEFKFRFDHGAQYIGKPKTPVFQSALDDWIQQGFVKEWKGRFGSVNNNGDEVELLTVDTPSKPHYVGYPRMNSICQNLLDHKNIDIVLQTRACAVREEGIWKLTAHGNDRTDLGSFHWLIGSDRLSGTNNRADLRGAPVDDFKSLVSSIANVPSLTLMVAFDSSLENLSFDGIQFSDDGDEWESLAWAARDSSKPGRERVDNKECWVVQSNPRVAQYLIAQLAAVEGQSFETTKKGVAEKAEEILMADFVKAVEKLNDGVVPGVAYSIGHRWSAAFPNTGGRSSSESYVDKEQKFAACGDYLGSLTGRIEGAYLSGVSAACAVMETKSPGAINESEE